MVVYTLDTETYNWNNKKQLYEPDLNAPMIMCNVRDNKGKHYLTESKKQLWLKLINDGMILKQRKNLLTVYGHNMAFDFYKIITEDSMKNIVIHSDKPFIASYMSGNDEIIKFIDSMGMFGMSLKKVGEMIGKNKTQMPEDILNGKIKEVQFAIIAEYCRNDCEVLYQGIEKFKELTKNTGVIVRRYITFNQIANTVMLNKMSKVFQEDTPFFYDNKKRITHKSQYHELIRNGLRGGKCDTYKLGKYDNVTGIDINSLYTWSAIKMDFPDLRTERFIHTPMKYNTPYLDYIGISNVMIKNVNDDYGFIGVRTDADNHYLKKGQIGIGTWTNQELKYATENGYEIIDCEWSIIYEKYKINPYEIILPEIYEMKKMAKNEFERYFYKGLMNRSFGKLAQYKPYTEYRYINIEDAEKYIAKNYELVAGNDYNRLIKKEGEYNMKTYYAPLIVAYIYGKARMILHEEMKKMPVKDILYCDTDSIYFINNHKNKFNIGTELGQFKIEHENESIYIKGRKTYMIGNEIKISGFYKSDLNKEDFMNGIAKSKKMNTLKNSKDINKWGTFEENTRDLNKQEKNTELVREMYNKQKLMIDMCEENIEYYIDIVENIL